jgi:hypothetical protein|mmetsp:Transcript_35028/g.96763  ORF Transcript_35028/g.96763 Transcript_35028/m.96763 type:complete len:205 (-) Transcript_35028:251-865(-)
MALTARPRALDAPLSGLISVPSGCARFWSRGAESTCMAHWTRFTGCLSAASLERPFAAELARPVRRVAVGASVTFDLVVRSCSAAVPRCAGDAPRLSDVGLVRTHLAWQLLGCSLGAACACSTLDARSLANLWLMFAGCTQQAPLAALIWCKAAWIARRRRDAADRTEEAWSGQFALGGAGQASRVGVCSTGTGNWQHRAFHTE